MKLFKIKTLILKIKHFARL